MSRIWAPVQPLTLLLLTFLGSRLLAMGVLDALLCALTLLRAFILLRHMRRTGAVRALSDPFLALDAVSVCAFLAAFGIRLAIVADPERVRLLVRPCVVSRARVVRWLTRRPSATRSRQRGMWSWGASHS